MKPKKLACYDIEIDQIVIISFNKGSIIAEFGGIRGTVVRIPWIQYYIPDWNTIVVLGKI